ncbi:MAG: response regulator [Devosia sp.]
MSELIAPRQLSVLLLEDQVVILLAAEDALIAGGYLVKSATSTLEALRLLDEYSFDAAVLDIGMQFGDSSRVAEALEQRGAPFLFSTASNEPLDGFTGVRVLSKPFRDEALLAAIASVISEARPPTSHVT